MTLKDAAEGTEYVIREIETEDGDEELVSFLFSLGCYSGEAIKMLATISTHSLPGPSAFRL